MYKEEILQRLREMEIILTDGHFVYTSGRHGEAYVNKDEVYPDTELISSICQHFADSYRDSGATRVIAPAVGGVALSQWTAHHLTQMNGRDGPKVLALYAEKEGEGFVIKRGYERKVPGEKILVVEDVVTTGGSILGVIDAVRALGGNIVGAAIFCNRCGITAEELGIPRLHSFYDVPLESFAEDDMPTWLRERPVNTSVGKGREYLARTSGGP